MNLESDDAFVGYVIFGVAVLVILMWTVSLAFAHFYQSADEDEWMMSLQMPGTKASCCGKSDAYWADKVEPCPPLDGDCALVAVITDSRDIPDRPPMDGQRVIIPKSKVRKSQDITPNPTQHNIVFTTASGYVFCWEPLVNG